MRLILNVLAIHGRDDFRARRRYDTFLEAVEPHVLDERVQRAHDANLRLAAQILVDVVRRVLANIHADFLVVHAHLNGVVAVHNGVDGDDRNAGFLRFGDGRLDAVHVDRDHQNRIHLLLNIRFDCVVLRVRVVVRVVDLKIDAGGFRGRLRALIHLRKEECLLVDLDERDLLLVSGKRAAAGADDGEREEGDGQPAHGMCCVHRSPFSE